MKQTYRLNESELRGLIAECVQEVLNEEQKEGLVGDMFRGVKQGIKNYNAGVNNAKADMKSAKADYKAANKTNKYVNSWATKDIQTLTDMQNRYAQVNPNIASAVQILKDEIVSAQTQASTNLDNANNTYSTAKTGVQDAKKERSQNMVNRIANKIYPGQQNTQTAPTNTQEPEPSTQSQDLGDF